MRTFLLILKTVIEFALIILALVFGIILGLSLAEMIPP